MVLLTFYKANKVEHQKFGVEMEVVTFVILLRLLLLFLDLPCFLHTGYYNQIKVSISMSWTSVILYTASILIPKIYPYLQVLMHLIEKTHKTSFKFSLRIPFVSTFACRYWKQYQIHCVVLCSKYPNNYSKGIHTLPFCYGFLQCLQKCCNGL